MKTKLWKICKKELKKSVQFSPGMQCSARDAVQCPAYRLAGSWGSLVLDRRCCVKTACVITCYIHLFWFVFSTCWNSFFSQVFTSFAFLLVIVFLTCFPLLSSVDFITCSDLFSHRFSVVNYFFTDVFLNGFCSHLFSPLVWYTVLLNCSYLFSSLVLGRLQVCSYLFSSHSLICFLYSFPPVFLTYFYQFS